MIRGMVARLADKLKQDGSDIEGWERLLRAYVVLGERDRRLPPPPTHATHSPAIPTSSAASTR